MKPIIRESGENYLELIFTLSREQGDVRSIDIARRLGVSRASVSKALTVLREAGLVEPAYYGKVVLTAAGRQRAAQVHMRHELLRRYLTEVLGVEPDTAEADACRMEHVVSDALMDRLRGLLSADTP